MRHHPLSRAAFTLIELLIVIAILAILAALTAWGVFSMIGATQRNNTNTTIRVVNKMLQDRWAAVIADARKETPSTTVVNLAGEAGLGKSGGPRARVIWIKLRLAEAFPVNYQEIGLNPWAAYIAPNPTKPYFVKYQDQWKLAGSPASLKTPAESSACLLMALNGLKAGDVSIDDQLKHAVQDTIPKDGLPELIDGWGNSLAFFRFPKGATGLNDPGLQAANPGKGNPRGLQFADPIDTDGTLINVNWYPTPGRFTFELVFHPVKDSVTPANAYYVAPVIVSAGHDGKFGLKFSHPTLGMNYKDAGIMLEEMSIDIPTPPPPLPPPVPPRDDFDLDNIYSFAIKGN